MLASLRNFTLTLACLPGAFMYAQQENDTLPSSFSLQYELRPRVEYRENYRLQRSDTLYNDAFVSVRNRMTASLKLKRINLHASPQLISLHNLNRETHTIPWWGFYELYADVIPHRKWLIRAGRQHIEIDNARLFAQADWAQQSRSHEALRLFYRFSEKVQTDITLASANRTYNTALDARWSPVAQHVYQALFIHHLTYRLHKHWHLTTLNFYERFEWNYPTGPFQFITHGGRITYADTTWQATISGYFNWHDYNRKTFTAFYLQPEVKLSVSNFSAALGAEWLSSNKPGYGGHIDPYTYTFPIRYGVAFRFMGNMNFFTRFPEDISGSGLVNPYAILRYQLTPRFLLRADAHLFYTQHRFQPPYYPAQKRYLGFENDVSIDYRPSKKMQFRSGLSYYLPSETMHLFGKIRADDNKPLWFFLMLSVRPQLLSHTFGKK